MSTRLKSLAGAVTALSIVVAGAPAPAESAFDCVIDPSLVVKIGSPVGGLLAEVLVRRGDRVERGQILARLESDVEAATVEFNRVRAIGTAELEAQEARLALAQSQLDRALTLFERNAVSAREVDEREAEVAVGLTEVARARQHISLAKIEWTRSEKLLARRELRSPIDGLVIERRLSAAEYIHQEGHVATLARLDPLYVETFLPVALYDRMAPGMIAVVEPAPPFAGRFEAEVTVVDQVFDAASATFGLRLELPNPGGRIAAGLRCRVTFRLDTAEPDLAAAATPDD